MQLKKINVNPAKRNTDDAYVKVLTIALDISYKKAYKLLAEYGMQQCLSMNDSRLFRSFMKYIGYVEKQLDKKYVVSNFAEHIPKDKVYILIIGKKGATVIKNNAVYDSFDSRNKIVNSYYIIS